MNSHNLDFERINTLLGRHNIATEAAEVHGMLCGMLAGGMALESRDWLPLLADFINQGESLGQEIQDALIQLYNQTCQQLVETEFSLLLCLPDDAAPINERGAALIKWIQGFLLGFGLNQTDLAHCSADVREALEDFSEISRMDEEMSEDEESERALFEVLEYVRISAMLCFNELGKSPARQQETSKTVH